MSRCIHTETTEDLMYLMEQVRDHMASDDRISPELESWLDDEFHRIYVAYAYADVTKPQ